MKEEMGPMYRNGSVVAHCPNCGAYSTFEWKHRDRELGSTVVDGMHKFGSESFNRVIYRLLRCANCGRGGLAEIHAKNKVEEGALESFEPRSIEHVSIPKGIPDGIVSEFREAELCSSFGAWRGAAALLRSALEKALMASGYTMNHVKPKIDAAKEDGVITEARGRRADKGVRILANDVLHQEWREVSADEVFDARLYVQRILEDLYTDRDAVEEILIEKRRLATDS